MLYINNLKNISGLATANEQHSVSLTVDKKGGISVGWNALGSAQEAWDYVKKVLLVCLD